MKPKRTIEERDYLEDLYAEFEFEKKKCKFLNIKSKEEKERENYLEQLNKLVESYK